MKYLLDVNMLVALGHTLHVHHVRAGRWLKRSTQDIEVLATCPITELGFVRVSVQAGLQPDVATAVRALASLKASSPIGFKLWTDALGVDTLPRYVRKTSELTDGHLLELARANGAQLATLDGSIPDAIVVS